MGDASLLQALLCTIGEESVTVQVLGHRGASSAHRENSVGAFAAAREMGADGVELDVRRTRDAALAVHHDALLPDGRMIAEVDAADLPEDVPLLDEALTACGPMMVNIEIKNAPTEADYDPDEWVAAEVARLVKERGLARNVVLSSFNLLAIERVRAVGPTIRRGFLTDPLWDQYRCLERAVEGGHHVLHPHHLAVNAALVEACHAAGLGVTTWTVNDPDRMRWLADCGVDAIITDVIDVALAALR